MPLETGSGVRLAVFQETVHHAAFPGVYKGEYRRGLLVGDSHESSNTSERELALLLSFARMVGSSHGIRNELEASEQ